MFIGAVSFKALQAWLQEFLAVRAASSAKQELRERMVAAGSRNQSGSAAELALLAGRGLDALDPYFSKYLPQLIYTVIVTPILILVFWLTDITSGLTLLITMPLIPLFMTLIGWATAELQSRQFAALTRLSGHFSEVLKAFGTLKLFGRARNQEKVIAEVSSDLRRRTMKVLRVSFLSGFTLELTASLSVALIAVSVGMRLVNSQLDFGVALFLLILAPEAFLPLRAVGANFHASSEGIAAATQVLDYLDQPVVEEVEQADELRFARGITLIAGPSGVGKTTMFTELLGLTPDRGRFTWLGVSGDLRRELVSWMPQQPLLANGGVEANITGYSEVNGNLLAEALDFAELAELRGLDARGLSGGEAARVNLARAFYRLKLNGLDYLLLDEPTASVDISTARKIREKLRHLAESGINVVVISHEEEFAAMADEVIQVA
jgi:ATP-binding cassette, subfamily C, bacterial CydD